MKNVKKVELKATKVNGNNIPNFGPVKGSKDAHQYAAHFWGDDLEIYESFFVLLLDRANNPIAWAKISQGGISGTTVDLRIILKYAIDVLASGVICAHNHPSGNLTPSNADIQVTNRLKAALETLEINLIDHLILTSNGYYSFGDNGKI